MKILKVKKKVLILSNVSIKSTLCTLYNVEQTVSYVCVEHTVHCAS